MLQIILDWTRKGMTNEEFEKILEDLKRELTAKLAFLNNRVTGSSCTLSHKLFGLESYVVSPLYYRLQRHLTGERGVITLT